MSKGNQPGNNQPTEDQPTQDHPTEGQPGHNRPDQHALIDVAWQQVENARTSCSTDLEDILDGNETSVRADLRRWCSANPPDALTGYTLLHELHRGGQGVVYQGVQQSTGQKVAIKFMLGGVFSGAHERARFDREIHILAGLKHGNIVTIHDSGTAEHVAYFVMDYIEGRQLDEHVEQADLSLTDRLTLFARICDAVNAAHLHGVIHRDLKPGNIRIDLTGEPHILDFGLAKHTDLEIGEVRDQPDMTITGQFVGSLPWASPEQAEGRHESIDIRTDVYSLGVILYQMLTGSLPYELGGTIAESAQRIATVEPKNPRLLNPAVDDEITTIVLKALRKEADARYQSAGALTDDVRRYLDGEPIEAKRESISYVLRKQLSRHKAAVTMVAAFLVLIIIALFVSIGFWRQAVLARDAEIDQRRVAQANAVLAEQKAVLAADEADKAQAVTTFLTDMLATASPLMGDKSDVTVQEFVEIAAENLNDGVFDDRPFLEASIRQVIGKTYGGLGDYEKAEQELAIARRLYADMHGGSNSQDALMCSLELVYALRLAGKFEESSKLVIDTCKQCRVVLGSHDIVTAQCLDLLGDMHRESGDIEQAEANYREAVAILQALDSPDAKPLASAYNDLGLVLGNKGDRIGAVEALENATEMFTEQYGEQNYLTATSMSNLAAAYAALGDFDRAESLFKNALKSFRNRLGDSHPKTASTLDTIGLFYLKQMKPKVAAPLLREALKIRRKILGPEHPLVAYSLNSLAIAQYHLGQLKESVVSFEQCKKLFIATRGADHPSISTILNNIAAIHRTLGNLPKAVGMMREVLEMNRHNLGEDHPRYPESLHNLASVLLDMGSQDEAEPLLREAVARRTELMGKEHPETANSMDLLAMVLCAQGKLDEAELLSRASLGNRRLKFGESHLSVALSNNNLAKILGEKGELDEADQLARDAVQMISEHVPAEHWQIFWFRGNRGQVLAKRGDWKSAEQEWLVAYDGLNKALGPTHFRTRRIVGYLIDLYRTTGQAELEQRWTTTSQAHADVDMAD